MELAFNYVRHHITHEVEGHLLSNAKNHASFGGSVMRKNLIDMLDGIGLPTFLQIDSSEQLFHEKSDLLHTTSVLRYPVFVDGENYSGSTPKMLGHDLFLKMIDELLVPELNSLKNAVIVPTGKAVSDVLKYLVDEGKVENETILFNFPHPSGANGHRKSIYAANKELFKQQLLGACNLSGSLETSTDKGLLSQEGNWSNIEKYLKKNWG
ncbi:MAG: hypothetical protein LRY73_01930 [Bacillus sp. (in: Bacteria)]|nr:hypothetical protein [Bacillus sp. (in: firmicutes)]